MVNCWQSELLIGSNSGVFIGMTNYYSYEDSLLALPLPTASPVTLPGNYSNSEVVAGMARCCLLMIMTHLLLSHSLAYIPAL